MGQKQAAVLSTIDDILSRVGSQKKSEANTEAGSIGGSTTHPVKDVDDGTDDAQTGSRYSENTSDRKAEPNTGQPVEEAAEGVGAGGQDSVQMDIGVSNKATGEDSTNETNKAKDGKDDPGSSHAARTDNNSLDGMKYSDYQALSKKAQEQASDLLADISVGANTSAKKAETAPAAGKKAEAKPDAKVAADAAAAGYDLAGVLAGTGLTEDDQKAATASVVNVLEEVFSTGLRRAEKAAEYYIALANESSKKAAKAGKKASDDEGGGPPSEESEGEGEGEDSESESEGSGGSADMGGGGPSDEELLSAMLAGGEGMGAEDASAGMGGGGDMGAGMGGAGGEPGGGAGPEALGGGGGDPAAAAGGDDPLAALLGGGGGGAGGGDPAMAMGGGGDTGGGMPGEGGGMPGAGGAGGLGGIDLQTLQQILQELQISPEMLQAASAGKVAQALIERNRKGTSSQKTAAKKSNTNKAAAEKEYARKVIKEICGITE